MDPSLRNWGLAGGFLDLGTGLITVKGMAVLNAPVPTGKQVRQNSLDLISAAYLFKEALAAAEGAHAVFVEVPHGSQSARAMASYGICVGVLGALKSYLPIYELSADEVKLIATGTKTATKKQMIDWAMRQHPAAPWPTYTRKGKTLTSDSVAEHMADACAAIHAGVASVQFSQTKALMSRTS